MKDFQLRNDTKLLYRSNPVGEYEKPVLLMHGDRDGIVPISYAEHAAEVYPDVDYYVISGGGHGFYGNSLDDAFSHIFEYLKK